jgi:hypothetical protein
MLFAKPHTSSMAEYKDALVRAASGNPVPRLMPVARLKLSGCFQTMRGGQWEHSKQVGEGGAKGGLSHTKQHSTRGPHVGGLCKRKLTWSPSPGTTTMGTPWYADSEMPLYPPCATNTARFLWARRSFWGTQSSSMKSASRNGAINHLGDIRVLTTVQAARRGTPTTQVTTHVEPMILSRPHVPLC